MSNAIYVVSKETNEVLRKSRTLGAAVQFVGDEGLYNVMQTTEEQPFYICQSEFDKKKGDIMSNITDFIDI